MEKRDGGLTPKKGIDKLDVYQRELHYQKESFLDNGTIDFIFVMRHVLYDLAEYVDSLHAKLHALQAGKEIKEKSLGQAKIEVVMPTIEAFVNEGETILVNGLGAAMYDEKSYDVVILPDMSTLQDEYEHVIKNALRVARKRVIVGYYANSYKKKFEKYLDTLNLNWLKNEEVKEHYILDLET
jgi:hypothetical protein